MPRILRRFPQCCIPPTIWESSREDGLQDAVYSQINPNWTFIRFFLMFAGYDFDNGKAVVKEKPPFVKAYVPYDFLDSSLNSSGFSVGELDSSTEDYMEIPAPPPTMDVVCSDSSRQQPVSVFSSIQKTEEVVCESDSDIPYDDSTFSVDTSFGEDAEKSLLEGVDPTSNYGYAIVYNKKVWEPPKGPWYTDGNIYEDIDADDESVYFVVAIKKYKKKYMDSKSMSKEEKKEKKVLVKLAEKERKQLEKTVKKEAKKLHMEMKAACKKEYEEKKKLKKTKRRPWYKLFSSNDDDTASTDSYYTYM